MKPMILVAGRGRTLARIGAAFFVAWGLLHVLGGGMILAGALENADRALRDLAVGAAVSDFPTSAGPVVGSLLAYHAFNLTWVGLFVSIVAVTLNWRNSLLGFWLNVAVVGLIDLGLVLWFLQTGYIPVAQGMAGISLFLGGLLFSGLAIWDGCAGDLGTIAPEKRLAEGGLHA